MSNTIKYTAGTETLALKKGNYWIGTGDVIKGPTSETNFWNGYDCPTNGYVIYQNKASQGPSIYVANNDTELISFTNHITNAGYTTVSQCFSYFSGQTDKMVFNQDLGPIITSGLTLYLDAGFLPSYPREGTTWLDLSMNGYNTTLVNGPTFDSSNFGSITFDGTDDYSFITNSSFFDITTNSFFADVGYAWTVSCWFKFPVTPSGTRTGNQSWSIFGKSGGIGGAETLTIFVGSATDTTYFSTIPYYCIVGIRGSKTAISTGSVNTNTWNNAVVTWNGSAARIYFNGVDRGSANVGTGAIQTGFYATVGVTGYSGTIGNPPQYFQGNIGITQVYNRALSSAEVTQNFNAIKSRYGL